MNSRQTSLDLGLVGNGGSAALIDAHARVVWGCVPAIDGDPTFCALLSPKIGGGDFAIELEDMVSAEQHYVQNTAVLRTVLRDRHGGAVEITDFAPRWRQHGRFYRPVMLVRRLRPLAGKPRVRIVLRPLGDYGATVPDTTWGSNHVRYLVPGFTLRLTSDVPVRMVRESLPFVLDGERNLVLGPDETLTEPVDDFARQAEERTIHYWREWVRYLSIPLEWQDAVIRSAITLKLCQYEETGAIVAALTTSIPEAPDTVRNWDYRYCWLRDSAFVVRALNRLGATRTMEGYLSYVFNLATGDDDLQPLYGVGFESELTEEEVPALAGYRGMGPVRRGNLAWKQVQHDVYGSVVLASTQLFFDQRLDHPGDEDTFHRLEALGARAWALYDQPDAGIWEFRGRAEVHTYSSVMCWAACDRLARIAAHLGLAPRAECWRTRADAMHAAIIERAWDAELGHFVESAESRRLDASLLLLAELGFVAADDPRFVATVDAIGVHLRRGDGLYRYIAPDDFGHPETSFTICSFWYIEALAAIGRTDEARRQFEQLLARRNPLGLLSEDMAFEDGEAWGNFPQTYSHVGVVMAAMCLSKPWSSAV
ncbi:glycoside hydrolase family 15 protein [Luteimonas sp. MC1825]|uniref:glycoside hydrolase family 15 protein n=1 Tax=Luteimonas sp. MC1825 TaxID=2761107 RepID=UPI00161B2D15|nr:glycoside hydrolase family 15 protein [Luteimonas sp. MC1825]MBB6599977.1 glycoside hydrolase family 15 protein [Luteimonas sp. MC1825]QOC87683.1 glycoside hydrolase family 15 protein [Luteimonas sp. MC1825]